MFKIAITGANGYLASLIQASNNARFNFIPITRKDVDLTNTQAVTKLFQALEYDLVFHTAARPQTADCEQNPRDTYKVNTESAINIAKVCHEKNARFVFLSTEQVFNNRSEGAPYTEESQVDSTSVYGQQKMEVEKYLSDHNNDAVILRLSWMMGLSFPGVRSSPNIIENVMNALFYKKKTHFSVNETRGMTYGKNLAEQFEKIIHLSRGIYHFSSQNDLSTYEAARLIGKALGYNDSLINQYILPDHQRFADRFRDLRLSTNKIESHGIRSSTFENDIHTCLTDFGWLK